MIDRNLNRWDGKARVYKSESANVVKLCHAVQRESNRSTTPIFSNNIQGISNNLRTKIYTVNSSFLNYWSIERYKMRTQIKARMRLTPATNSMCINCPQLETQMCRVPKRLYPPIPTGSIAGR